MELYSERKWGVTNQSARKMRVFYEGNSENLELLIPNNK